MRFLPNPAQIEINGIKVGVSDASKALRISRGESRAPNMGLRESLAGAYSSGSLDIPSYRSTVTQRPPV